jgi:hypothetical protein
MLGFFAMCVIRMAPPYFESLSVKDIIARIATEPETVGKTSSDIRRKIDFVFNTNQIYELSWKDVKVFDRKGKKYIDANYEVRIPIMWKIDAVLKFNDLLYQVGDPKPVTNLPPAQK